LDRRDRKKLEFDIDNICDQLQENILHRHLKPQFSIVYILNILGLVFSRITPPQDLNDLGTWFKKVLS